MDAVGAGDDFTVEAEIHIAHAWQLRRMVGHELMANFIDRPVVNGHEIPVRAVFEQPTRGRVDAKSFC